VLSNVKSLNDEGWYKYQEIASKAYFQSIKKTSIT
jgi:hypothetical protein